MFGGRNKTNTNNTFQEAFLMMYRIVKKEIK